MKLPIITRDEYNIIVTSLLADIDMLKKRVKDLERQFAIEYDDAGHVVKTLADVPMAERPNVKVIRKPKSPLSGLSWPQRRAMLEKTDGFRNSNG